MEENAKKVAALLKVLANENRLLILCALIEKPQTVSEVAKKVGGISQSALSQHLSVLKAHNIVDFEKRGQYSTYSIADARVEDVIHVLKICYCQTGE